MGLLLIIKSFRGRLVWFACSPLTDLCPSYHWSPVASGIILKIWKCWELTWETSQFLTSDQKCESPPGHLLTSLKQFWVVRFKDVLASSCNLTSVSPTLWRSMELRVFVSQGCSKIILVELNWAVELNWVELGWVCCLVFLLACHWNPVVCPGTPSPEMWGVYSFQRQLSKGQQTNHQGRAHGSWVHLLVLSQSMCLKADTLKQANPVAKVDLVDFGQRW